VAAPQQPPVAVRPRLDATSKIRLGSGGHSARTFGH
jgi:hypothetical protein